MIVCFELLATVSRICNILINVLDVYDKIIHTNIYTYIIDHILAIYIYIYSKNTRVVIHFLLQRIFPTQESNPSVLHCSHILYWLSYAGRPYVNMSSLFFLLILLVFYLGKPDEKVMRKLWNVLGTAIVAWV